MLTAAFRPGDTLFERMRFFDLSDPGTFVDVGYGDFVDAADLGLPTGSEEPMLGFTGALAAGVDLGVGLDSVPKGHRLCLDHFPDAAPVRPPDRIETDRLVLRCWTAEDAPLLKEAVDVSLEHLRAWLPWSHAAPFSLEKTEEQLRGFRERFQSGEDFVYGVFSADEIRVLGGTGLHTRPGEGAFEIGYWVRADETNRGYATELARGLTEAGLALPGVERIEVHCDSENSFSRRVPERLHV